MRFTLIVIAGFLFTTLSITLVFSTHACFIAGAGTMFPSLQEAVHRASPGCTIILLAGEYEENVVIQKPVRIVARSYAKSFVLLSEGSSMNSAFAIFASPARPSTLRSTDPERPVIEIRSDGVEIRGLEIRGGREGIRVASVSNVGLFGNEISGSAQAGIALVRSEKILVSRNRVSRSETGILLDEAFAARVVDNEIERATRGLVLSRARQNELRGNRISSSEAEGILLQASNGNGLLGNLSEGNGSGLTVLDSQRNVLVENRMERNEVPFRVWGTERDHFVHRIEPTNTINGRPIYYLVGERDATIDGRDNPAYVALVNCEAITVKGVTLGPDSGGMILIGVRDSSIRYSVVNGAARGLYVRDSRGIDVVGSRIEGAQESGVSLIGSQGIRLLRNRVISNGQHGIWIQASESNALVENEISGNQASGVHLEGSREVRLTGNEIRGNWVGAYLERGGSHTVEANVIRDSRFGIFVQHSSDNRFVDNRLENNRHDTNVAAGLPSASPSSTQESDALEKKGSGGAGGS